MLTRSLRFNGFTPGLFRFVSNLSQVNSKESYDRYRQYYEANVLGIIKSFTREVGAVLQLLGSDLETEPRVGKTISRISSETRHQRGRPPYRPLIHISFPRRGAKQGEDALLYVGFYPRGVAVGFYPGGRLLSGPIQQGIKNNLKLFQSYLGERRVATRYSELVGSEEGHIKKWPLPATARRWMNLESFAVGEFFEHSDPVLYSHRFLDRTLEVMLDLYPLWLFAVSQDIKDDLYLYRENLALITRPHGTAAD